MPKVVNHDTRREEVAEATWRVIAAQGVEGATLREIAREAGFTTGVINHYFRNRDELMAFAYELIAEQNDARLTETLPTLPPGMPRVRAAVEALVPRELRSGRAASLLGFWSSAVVNERHRALNLASYGRYQALVREQVEEAVRVGDLPRHLDPEDVADQLIALGEGLFVRTALDPERYTPERRARLISTMLAMLAGDIAPDEDANR
jgi:AcrR family transcriptional regulator